MGYTKVKNFIFLITVDILDARSKQFGL